MTACIVILLCIVGRYVEMTENKKCIRIFDGLDRSLDRLESQVVYIHIDDFLAAQTAVGLP